MNSHTVPAVDILLVSYEQEDFLPGALDSILAQTYGDFRILAIDDGSKDRSPDILKDYRHRHPGKIFLLTHEGIRHRGIGETYKLGCSQLTGSLTAFLEADDRWQPDNLEKKIKLFGKYPEAGVVYSDCRPFGDSAAAFYWKAHRQINRLGTLRETPCDFFEILLRRNPVSSFSTFMVRTPLLEKIPWPPPAMARRLDWWILAHLALRTPFVFIPDRLVHWRIHRPSASRGTWNGTELWRYHKFLQRLYASLMNSLPSSSPEKMRTRRKKSLESALSEQIFIDETRNWFHPEQFFRHPLATLRFLTHILLKNSLH
jgi:glycosyltransferase involved in cell wall biosynthesis